MQQESESGVEEGKRRKLQNMFYYDPYGTIKTGQAALAEIDGAPSVSTGPSGSAAPSLAPITEPPLGMLVVELPSSLAPPPSFAPIVTIEGNLGPIGR